MNRFRCTGTSCEDSCCHGWRVDVDERRYQILKRKMDGTRAEREEFAANVQRDDNPARAEHQYAQLRLRPGTQMCGFLDPQKLCSVQLRYGEEALPDVCATYPRVVSETPDRTEIWGTLSCPELARLCLLHEDAMDLEGASAPIPHSLRLTNKLGRDAPPYQRYLDDLRATAFELLSRRQYPMSTRLFMLALLGEQTAPFFNRRAAHVDESLLAAVIDEVRRPDIIATWHRELGAMPAPQNLTAKLVTQLIRERMKMSLPQFRTLVERTLTSYQPSAGAGDRGEASIAVADLWNAYQERRQCWTSALPDRIDLYFENYAKNFWLRDWYINSSDLLAHAHRLLARVAVLRFLLFSQPSLLAAAGADNPLVKREALDGAAVQVFYRFARDVEHDASFIDLIAASLVEQGTNTFEHAAFLALM